MSGREILYDYGDDCGSGQKSLWDANGKELDFERVREIAFGEEWYPEHFEAALGGDAPRKLFCRGNAALLTFPLVMVCGARNASETALDLAYRCGRLLAESKIVTASGYARGADMAAHRGALDGGGSTLAFLPYGAARFKIHRDIQGAFDPERFLLVSETPPWQVFSSYTALRRNKLLAALAGAVIVIEPGETWGTWYSAERASRMGKPLFFLEGLRPEIIERMESLGGVRLAARDGEPDISPVTGKN